MDKNRDQSRASICQPTDVIEDFSEQTEEKEAVVEPVNEMECKWTEQDEQIVKELSKGLSTQLTFLDSTALNSPCVAHTHAILCIRNCATQRKKVCFMIL